MFMRENPDRKKKTEKKPCFLYEVNLFLSSEVFIFFDFRQLEQPSFLRPKLWERDLTFSFQRWTRKTSKMRRFAKTYLSIYLFILFNLDKLKVDTERYNTYTELWMTYANLCWPKKILKSTIIYNYRLYAIQKSIDKNYRHESWIKSRSGMYNVNSLHGQCWGCHFLISFLKICTDVSFLKSLGTRFQVSN